MGEGLPFFLDLLLQMGGERILFSADYPYGTMSSARAFLIHLPLSAADRERIAHGNSENLFHFELSRSTGELVSPAISIAVTPDPRWNIVRRFSHTMMMAKATNKKLSQGCASGQIGFIIWK
jgi:hypothetical protein